MTLLVEDSDGLSEVAGIAILAHEDYTSMKWFLSTFKKENKEACDNIDTFMTDKDLTERKALKELFPNASTQICRFHVLKIFSTHITTKIMNISNEEKDFCLSLLSKIVYSNSEEEYNEYYEKLVEKAPVQVVEYFNSNWNDNREEWCTYLMVNNLGNNSNNRVESMNGKMKEEVGRNNYMSCFAVKFFRWLSSHNRENDFKASKDFIKKKLPVDSYTEWENLYSNHLTDKAFGYVKTELEHHDYVTFWNEKFEENVINPENIEENYQMNYKSLQITTTLKSCECLHWLTLSLPCRHIFSLRKHYGLSLFSEDLCSVKWSKNYYRQHQRSFRNLNQKSITKVKQTQVSKVNLPQKNFDKIELQKQCKYIINDLKHTMSLSCGQYFENKLKVLNDINFFFGKGSDVTIVQVDKTALRINENSVQETTVLGKKVVSVFDKRKIITTLTDKIYNSSNYWLAENWNFKLETLRTIDNYWRQLIEINVYEKKVESAATTNENKVKKNTKFGQIIELDKSCTVSELDEPVKVNVRGRPKGATLNTIGLQKTNRQVMPFVLKSNYLQAIDLLNWLQLPQKMVDNVLRN
ncbi:GSCOCG00012624001-RA-CDS, partial [Cotesia congregata]